jgi:hypothetical protein
VTDDRKPAGISNRVPPEIEEVERETLARDDDAARDQAGHVIHVDPAEAEQDRIDGSAQHPDHEGNKRSRGERTSG